MTELEKWEKEFEELFRDPSTDFVWVPGHSKDYLKLAYLAACRARQTEIDRLKERVKELEQSEKELMAAFEACDREWEKSRERVKTLERLLCIANDYLVQHWDMKAEPLREIHDEVKTLIEKKG